MPSLASTHHEHHERLMSHVERLPAIADMIGRCEAAEIHAVFEPERRVIVERLAPHMDAIEQTLYGHMQEIMGPRHSMVPMREEHTQVRRLVASLDGFGPLLASGSLDLVEGMRLRRTLYRLYSLLKVHLGEETLYLDLLEHSLSEEEKELLAVAIDHVCAEPA
jgi:hypothetical protein